MALDRSRKILEVSDNLAGSIPSYGSDERGFWQDDAICGFGFVGNLHERTSALTCLEPGGHECSEQ